MADQPPYDTIMKFVLKGDHPVWGQSTLQVAPGDDFMTGFKAATDDHHYSNFFEVQSFDFSLSVEPEDAGTGNLSHGHGPAVGPYAGAQSAAQAAGRVPTKGPAGKGAGDPWQRWRSATEEQARKMRFALKFDSFRFTRSIDGASPTFFQQCARQQSFDSATLVRRVASSMSLTRGIGMAYMRIVFTDVMLKGVKWTDGDTVSESTEFVCNGLTFEYKRQSADGSLHHVKGGIAKWDRKLDSERKDSGAS